MFSEQLILTSVLTLPYLIYGGRSGILTRPWGLTSTGSNGMFRFYEKLGIGIKTKQLYKTLPIFMYSKR